MINETSKLLLEQFGSHVRSIRVSKKLSYRKLATKCNIDFSNLRKIEQGMLNVTLTTIVELAKGLEVPASELLSYPGVQSLR
jgi:transcriptional regulator with XRE-family HTH domain